VKTTIACQEFYGAPPGGERQRLTVAVGRPVHSTTDDFWSCKVAIADVLRPTVVVGGDSFEALARAVSWVRQHLAGMRAEGWEFSSDREGRDRFDHEDWFVPRTG
jgi:hypothetical protein